MYRERSICAFGLAVAVVAGRVPAQTVTFTDLGILPGCDSMAVSGVSGDGSVVTGTCWRSFTGSSTYRAFRWSENGGMQSLGVLSGMTGSYATAISADGTAITGYSATNPLPRAGQSRAFRWTEAEEMQLVGAPNVWSVAYATNASGSVIVGQAALPSQSPFHWALTTGMQPVPELPLGSEAWPMRLSDDGTVMVGIWRAPASQGIRIFRMGSDGIAHDLGMPPGIAPAVDLYSPAVNRGGSVVAGVAQTNSGQQVGTFIWTQSTGMTNLFNPGDPATMRPTAISDDGLTVWGSTPTLVPPQPAACYWTATTGLVILQDELASRGLNLSGITLETVSAISRDGTKIVVTGSDGLRSHAWLVQSQPGRCTHADVAAVGGSLGFDGQLTSEDVIVFLNAFFAGDLSLADIVSLGGRTVPDGQLTADDVVAFLSEFVAGCP